MRIIAGEFGGRVIEAPEGLNTRPMLSRVRESMFSTLGNAVLGGRVLDLYAGSGSLGIEALSRGAEHVRFVEKHPLALEVLRRNIETLDVAARVFVQRGDALDPSSWRSRPGNEPPKPRPVARSRRERLAAREARPEPEEPVEGAAATVPYDVVLFDPPYRLLDDPITRAELLGAVDTIVEHHMNPGGVFVFHSPDRAMETLRLPSGRKGDLRTYGTSAILYLWKS